MKANKISAQLNLAAEAIEKRPVHAEQIAVVKVSQLKTATPPKSAKDSMATIVEPVNIHGLE